MYLLAAYRIHVLARQLQICLTVGQWLGLNLVTLFYRLFLPGGSIISAGIRLYKILQQERNFAGAASALFSDRVLTTFGLALVGAVSWYLDRPVLQRSIGPMLCLFLAGIGMLLFLLLWERSLQFVQRIADRLPLPQAAQWTRAGLSTLRLLKALRPSQLLTLFFLALLPHVIGGVTYYLLGLSLDLPIGLVAWTWIRSVVMIVTMLPISISGIGVRDSVVLYLLYAYGISEDRALAFSLLVFGTTVLLGALLGGVLEAWNVLIAWSISRRHDEPNHQAFKL